jgi:hypothetical protein
MKNPVIAGVSFAYGRIPKGQRERFIDSITTGVYRLIVEGTSGGFGSGFSDFVLLKTRYGWQVARFSTGARLLQGFCYQTRTECVRAIVRQHSHAGSELERMMADAIAHSGVLP